jgi:hypothetical protein
MTHQAPKKIYLTNKELLASIHASKKTFCSFVDPAHADFDHITDDVKNVTSTLIEEIRLKKSRPRGMPHIDIDTIDPETIVVRVMTYEHIPLDPDRIRKSRTTDQSYARTPFNPFKHYILKDGVPVEVCRSHWMGGIANGHFCIDHGKATNTLAKQWMMLAERYSRRANYRGYSYNEEFQGQALMQLSQVGLQFDESKSDNPFAFYTTVVKNSFVRIINLEKRNQVIRDDILEMSGASPSYSRQSESEWEHLKKRNEQ